MNNSAVAHRRIHCDFSKGLESKSQALLLWGSIGGSPKGVVPRG